jgi:hypothetical protein
MIKSSDRGRDLYGMVIEIKPTIAYMQREIAMPAMRWLRLDTLPPAR